MIENLVEQLMTDRPDEWLSHLETTYKIAAVRDGALVSLKYDQIESPMGEPIVQQCRGMVVCTETRRVLAWPYHKFWNHGESGAARIDWSTARVQEKLDGSLMILYWHQEMWCVASSGHPTAGGSFGSEAHTFRDAFWEVLHSLGIDVSCAEPTVTYMFELCHTPNRVVVRHERPRIVLHGARDLLTGRELNRVQLELAAHQMRCEIAREFSFHTLEATLAAADVLDPIAQEGFVVVDAQANRVKIKSPRYVILHHMKGAATPRRAIELWQTGETGELLAHFPEMATTIEPIQVRLNAIADHALRDFEENRIRPSRKDFAMAVKDRPYASVLFRLLDVEAPTIDDAKAIMRRQSTASLERMLDA